MSDYPLMRQLLCFFAIVLAPKSIDKVISMRLDKVSIFADRTSPALSAIQDALTLKDLEFELNHKRGLLSPDDKVEKVDLKGMKISLNEIQPNEPIQELALRGESIDVRHFSNKFINVNTKRPMVSTITISTPDNVEDTIEKKSLEDLKLASAPELKVRKKVLSSGIVLKVVKDQTDKEFAAEKVASAPLVASNTNSQQLTTAGQQVVQRGPLVKLSGAIRLNGGSFTRSGSFAYYIERKHKGKTYEALTLRGDQTNYEIELLDKRGFLAIELRSPAGEILAYGESDLPKDNKKLLNLVLEPSAGLFSGQSVESIALESEGELEKEEILVADSKTFVSGIEGNLMADEEGFFGDAQMFSKRSEFLSSTVKKNYWPTLSLTEAGKAHYPRLVKRSVIERLEADLDPFGEAVKIESLLLGKVTHKGLNKRGMKVEVFGQNYQRPIYFSSQGKPDSSLQETSSHGGFVFTNLPDGGYLIQILNGDALLAQKWFVVRSGHISRGQIDLRDKPEKLIFLETYPSYAKEDRTLRVQELGLDDPIEVNALAAELTGLELGSKTTPSVTVLEIAGATQRGFRQYSILSSKSTDVTIKRVNKAWLDSYLNRQRSNRSPNLGLIVGFINDSNFSVVKLSTESLTERSEVFYFDRSGNPTGSGVKGGGFVITNTKLGFQPLVVELEEEQRFLNKVVYTTSGSVSVFQ